MWMKQKDEPIRVAQIMGKLWAGGVEMVVFNYYRAIDAHSQRFPQVVPAYVPVWLHRGPRL